MRYQLVALEGLNNSYCNNLSSRHLFDLVFCRQIQQSLIYYSKTFYRKFQFYFLPKATITAKIIPKIAPPDIDPVPPELITSMVWIPGKPESFFAKIFASFFAALPEPSESTRRTMRRFLQTINPGPEKFG